MRRSLIAWLCAVLLLNSFYVVGSSVNENTASMPVSGSVSYVPHAPIRIDSDADFPGIASSGDGSEGNPWIIEGWDINGTGYGYCIYIGNSSEYFEIRDCYLHEASGNAGTYFRNSGLVFYNVQNGTIANNIASNNIIGIHLSSSSGNTIYHNNFINNTNQAYDITGTNYWDNGYPSGGNYWSDLPPSNQNVENESFFASGGEEGFYLNHNEHTAGFYGTVAVHEIYYVWDNDWSFIYTLVEGVDYDVNLTTGWIQLYWGSLMVGDQFYSNYTYLGDPADIFCGPDQDLPGSDGICDSPYSVPGGSIMDNYPLMAPTIDGRISREPIRIDSNSDFDAAHGVSAGDGTELDPWIIERYDIDGTGYGYCIYVGNTTDYFVVRDCFLHEASGVGNWYYFPNSGLALYDVQNASIANNNASFNDWDGIHICYSSGNTIANNTVFLNYWEGICIEYSDGNTFIDNNASYNWDGIYAYSSSKNTITNNTIFNNDCDGICLYSTSNNIIIDNTLSLNYGSGIYSHSSSSNTIADNVMIEDGIYFWGDLIEHWNTHTINTSNTVNGKPVYYWKNQTGGTVPSGAGQVILGNCTNVIVENQNVSWGSMGIGLGFSSHNIIANNTASNSDDDGIKLRYSNNNTITNNNASSCDSMGLCQFTSMGNEISYNNFSDNGYGIYSWASSSNNFHNNTASNNHMGIHFQSCTSTVNHIGAIEATSFTEIYRDPSTTASIVNFSRDRPRESNSNLTDIYSDAYPGTINRHGGDIISRQRPLSTADNDTYSDSSLGEIKRYENNTVLVKLKPQYSRQSSSINTMKIIESEFGAKTVKTYAHSEIFKLDLNGKISVEDAVRRLSSDPRVLYAEPDYMISLTDVPNDPGFDSLWGLHNSGQTGGISDADIDAPEAWDISTGSGDVVVAVIDTGVDYNHEDLADNMWTNTLELNGVPGIDDDGNGYIDDIYGIDTYNNDTDPLDDHFHGTHCSGTIGAVGNNSVGVSGVNWNVSIMALKFINADGYGSDSGAIECIEYAIKMKDDYGVNIKVLSNSWGSNQFSQALYDAIALSRDSSILFAAAAGNSYADTDYVPHYPSSYNLTNIISVAATDSYDNLPIFGFFPVTGSNYGASSVDVAAPGHYVNSTKLNNSYGYASGTSMATPHVSGLAALIAAANPTYDWMNIKNLIMTTVDHPPDLSNKLVSEGRINAHNALTYSPTGMLLTVQSPGNGNRIYKGLPVDVAVSLSDGIQPITNAFVNVTFSSGDPPLSLFDNGLGTDQVAGDSYYSGSWTHQQEGEVVLNISASASGYVNVSKEIRVVFVSGNTIDNNTLTNNNYGLFITASNFNTITNNNASFNRYYGIRLYSSSSSNIIINNTAFSNGDAGISLYAFCSNNTITHNTVSNNYDGIYLHAFCNRNTISHNSLSSNTKYGLFLYYSSSNTVTHNNALNNTQSISLFDNCSYNTITNNNASSNSQYGIYLYTSCNGNVVSNNTASSNYHGISIESSSGNTLTNNTVSSNNYGIFVTFSSNGNVVSNNTASLNNYGIFISISSGNIIANNTASSNDYGVFLSWTNGGSIIANNTASSNDYGFYISSSNGNTIVNNTASNNNGYGIYLMASSNSTIYQNNFIDNTNQAYDDSSNFWDNGYPSGGNYWSDYSGIDILSGPNQDEAGFDGIGDIPYVFDFAQDNYPLWPHEFNGTSFSISLVDGWNLISFPIVPACTNVEYLFASFSGNWDVVKWYNSNDPADPWKTHRVGASTNDLIDIDNTMGFWLHVTDSTDDLIIYGTEPVTTNISLSAGWNLVSYPTTNTTTTVADALWGTGADRVEVCDLAEPGLIKEVGPTYIMQPGEGYWIHVSVDSVWTVNW